MRLNEFGIYELDTDQNVPDNLNSAVTSSESSKSSNQNFETVADTSELTTTAASADATSDVSSVPGKLICHIFLDFEFTYLIIAETTNGSEVSNETEKTNGPETTNEATSVPTSATPSTTAPTTATAPTTTSTSNGERERWKQRFPSNTMGKTDIICCKQCEGNDNAFCHIFIAVMKMFSFRIRHSRRVR